MKKTCLKLKAKCELRLMYISEYMAIEYLSMNSVTQNKIKIITAEVQQIKTQQKIDLKTNQF